MSEKVHVKVIKGSVGTWKDGSYEKGETFEISREEALKIDPSFIQILEDLPAAEEVTPASPEQPETSTVNIEASENDAEKPTLAVAEVGEVQEPPKKKRKKAEADA